MSRHTSPFAELSGAEKQIRWLEYQSIRLPYVQADLQPSPPCSVHKKQEEKIAIPQSACPDTPERPQPPPEVPRTMSDFQRTRHSQYDAVIARMKQAELQSRRFQTTLQVPKQTQ